MTEDARKARNEYMRQYRKKNPDKIKKISERHWERKAHSMTNDSDPEPNKANIFNTINYLREA